LHILKIITPRLIQNHWPTISKSTKDIVSGRDFQSEAPTFVPDRFGNPDSAIRVNNITNCLQAPSDIYFSSDFSTTMWIKMLEKGNAPTLFDFGNGADSDNIIMNFHGSLQPKSSVRVEDSSNFLTSNKKINLNEWNHLAFIVKDKLGYLYLNGTVVTKAVTHMPRNIPRSYNYIERSNWEDELPVKADFDDIKICNRGLTDIEVFNDFSNNKQ
jgi:hypothetical protein